MIKLRYPLLFSAVLLIAGCQAGPYDSGYYGPSRSHEAGCLAGSVTGAIVGGLIGSTIGEGRGTTLATAAGIGLGSLAGNRLACN